MADSETSPTQSTAALDQLARPDLLTQKSVDPLTEDLGLAFLQRCDLLPEAIEHLSKNAIVTKSRKVRFALASHPRAPRHLSLRLVREFYTIDLMRFALLPAVAADIKHAWVVNFLIFTGVYVIAAFLWMGFDATKPIDEGDGAEQ